MINSLQDISDDKSVTHALSVQAPTTAHSEWNIYFCVLYRVLNHLYQIACSGARVMIKVTSQENGLKRNNMGSLDTTVILDKGKYLKDQLAQLKQNLNTCLVDIGQIQDDDTNLVQAKKFVQSLDGQFGIKVIKKSSWRVQFSIAFT